MQIDERITNDFGILRLAGRLTVNDQPGLLKGAVAGLVQKGVLHVILDLTDVRYIDSTRLGELIGAHVMISRYGGRLVLAGTPLRVRELLRLSNLTDVFEQVESADAALSMFTSSPV